MQPEVTHATVFPVCLGAALPVYWLVGVEVAAVAEACFEFNDLPELAVLDHLGDPLRAREKWEFARTSDDDSGVFVDDRDDSLSGWKVDSEWLFGEEVLPCPNAVDVDLLVQVVRNGAVDRLNVRICEKLPIVGGGGGERVVGFEPLHCAGIDVRRSDDHRLRRHVQQMHPTSSGAGEFSPHESATDHAELDLSHRLSSSAARSGVQPWWTTPIRARVMPAGLGCWMTFLP